MVYEKLYACCNYFLIRNHTMWHLFRKPIEKSSLEAWSKICDDVAKVTILATPVMLYKAEETLIFRFINIGLLFTYILYLSSYC